MSLRLVALLLAASLLLPAPARAEEITLTREEAQAIQVKLVEAKPNIGAVAVMGFLAPGSAQAYMGHVDRSMLIWGGYLVGFTAIKALVPASPASPGGPKLSDLAVTSFFLAVAAASAVDAYFLAQEQRAEYDKAVGVLTDRLNKPGGYH